VLKYRAKTATRLLKNKSKKELKIQSKVGIKQVSNLSSSTNKKQKLKNNHKKFISLKKKTKR